MKLVQPKELDLKSTNVPADSTPPWSSGSSYSKGTKVQHQNRIFESLIDGNQGKVPPENTAEKVNPASWKDVEAVNAHRMFDRLVSSVTTNPASIDVTLGAGRCDVLCLFGLEATSLTVTMTDPNEGEMLNKEIELLQSFSSSWTQFFFGEAVFRRTLVLWVPLTYSADLSLFIKNEHGDAKCAHCVLGRSNYLGATKYGVSAGIMDYSRKTTDVTGETTFERRSYAKRMALDLHIPKGREDAVFLACAEARANPMVWLGDDSDSSSMLQVFGTFKDFNIVFSTLKHCACSLEIEGLI